LIRPGREVKYVFKTIYDQAKKLNKDQRGQGMAEYGLIIALVAVVAIMAFTTLGDRIKDRLNEANNALSGRVFFL